LILFKLQGQKGFTVVELIVVIGVLSLLMAIALPRLETSTYRLMDVSKGLRDDIRYVRCIKMTEGQHLRVFFQRTRYLVFEGTKAVKVVNVPMGYSLYHNFSGSQTEFSFNGAPITGGGTVVLVNDINKKYCEITVVPGTGRILFKNKVFSGYVKK